MEKMLISSVRLLLRKNSLFRPLGAIGSFSKCNQTIRKQSSAAGDVELNPDLIYNQQHLQIKKSLLQVIEKDINPFVAEWEKAENFPAHEIFKKLGDGGFLGATKAVEYGGLGLDWSYNLAIAEELGKICCGSIPMAIGVQMDMSTPALSNFGSDELKREFLAPAISGDYVTSIAVSEPSAGSDVAGIRTRAEKSGDDYIINGSKMWITNSFHADWFCVLCNTSREGGIHSNKSLIIVPAKTPGVILNRKIDKLGMKASDTGEIFFEDVRVPQKYCIGEEGQGFMYQMLQFQYERLFAAATCIEGLMLAINETVEYTQNRNAFGKPILANQVVHFRLAELETEVEALRSMIYRTVGKLVQGEDTTKLASMCKLKAGRLCREVTDSCLQYWGGMGYTNEVTISRLFRDMRLISIGGGADEVMLSIICKYLGTLPNKDGKYS